VRNIPLTTGTSVLKRRREGTTDFIAQQLQILATVQAEQEQRDRQQQKRKLGRPGTVARAPEIPSVPEIPPP
jgi:hypothetical protein